MSYQDVLGIVENARKREKLLPDAALSENKRFREGCERNGLPLVLIEDNYEHTVERMLT